MHILGILTLWTICSHHLIYYEASTHLVSGWLQKLSMLLHVLSGTQRTTWHSSVPTKFLGRFNIVLVSWEGEKRERGARTTMLRIFPGFEIVLADISGWSCINNLQGSSEATTLIFQDVISQMWIRVLMFLLALWVCSFYQNENCLVIPRSFGPMGLEASMQRNL